MRSANHPLRRPSLISLSQAAAAPESMLVRADLAATEPAWVELLPEATSMHGSISGVLAQRRAGEQASLLALGLAQLDQQQWAAADETLRRARDLRMDHGEVLAALALARCHNPSLDPSRRRTEATAMVALAMALEPDDAAVEELARRVHEELGGDN